MNNFLITYNTDQLYNFFSDTGEACTVGVYLKTIEEGEENFTEIFPPIALEDRTKSKTTEDFREEPFQEYVIYEDEEEIKKYFIECPIDSLNFNQSTQIDLSLNILTIESVDESEVEHTYEGEIKEISKDNPTIFEEDFTINFKEDENTNKIIRIDYNGTATLTAPPYLNQLIITYTIPTEQDEYYVRDMLDASLKTKEFILDSFEEDSKTFKLSTDEWVAFYDETSFALRESGNLDYTFSITNGQVSIDVIGPVEEQIIVQLKYYCGFPLIEGETYKVEIDNTSYEFEAKVRDEKLYLGDYSAFFGEESEEPIEPDKETITIDSKKYAEVNSYVTYSEDEETKYKITFNKNGDDPIEYIVTSAQTTIQQEGQDLLVAYVGNLNIYDESAPATEEPFFIYTAQSEDGEGQTVYISYLYVKEAGTYKLKVESYKINEIPALKGAALVSFANVSGSEISDKYGIGINSSDQGLTLPERAISLFETELDNSSSGNKIRFNYRGILGTLPDTLNMEPTIKEKMKGTQGIYTDNMYIGDKDQYLAYYTYDKDANKKRLEVTGGITATSLTIDSDGNKYNGIDAINISGYSLTITIEENSVLEKGKVYLYPHLYHNGIEQLPETGKEEEFYSNFKWYENDVLLIDRIDPDNGGRIVANRENKYRLTYSFADGATEGAQPIQPIYVEPTEYITDIDREGIKVHPKDWAGNSHYIQLDGNGMYIKDSDRFNALTVDWDGNVEASGTINAKVEEFTYNDFSYKTDFNPVTSQEKYIPTATKFGRIVTLSGVINCSTAQSSIGNIEIGKVPSGCEPLQTLRILQKGGGVNKYLLEIQTDGTMIASMYGTTADTPIPRSAWLHITTTYISNS